MCSSSFWLPGIISLVENLRISFFAAPDDIFTDNLSRCASAYAVGGDGFVHQRCGTCDAALANIASGEQRRAHAQPDMLASDDGGGVVDYGVGIFIGYLMAACVHFYEKGEHIIFADVYFCMMGGYIETRVDGSLISDKKFTVI